MGFLDSQKETFAYALYKLLQTKNSDLFTRMKETKSENDTF
jgi:hypothetical protein